VVVGDFNQDIRGGILQEWKDRLGLNDALLENLNDNEEAPNTYQRGKNPIDTILCTGGIEVVNAGYLPLGEGVGDHRPLFVDVTIASTLGVNLPPVKKVAARRLKLQDPRIVNRYNKHLKQFFQKSSLFDKAASLQARITHPLKEAEVQEYEHLDKLRIEGMQHAEKKCRKFKMGGVPWTPELSKI
jgi:hypothetical protein